MPTVIVAFSWLTGISVENQGGVLSTVMKLSSLDSMIYHKGRGSGSLVIHVSSRQQLTTL